MSVISHNGNDEFEFEFESDSDEDIVISMLSNTLNAPVKKTIPAPVRTSPAPPRSWLTERLLSEDTQVNLNGRRPSKTDFSMDQTRQFSHFNAQRSASPALGISTKINPKETPIGGSNPIPIRSPRFSTNSLLPPQKDYGSLPNDPNPFPVVNQDSFRPEVPIRSNSMRPTYGIHNLNRLQDHRPSLGNNQRRRPSFSRQYNNVRIDRNNFEPHSNTSSPLRVSTSVTDYSNDHGNRISANASESDGITKTRRSSKLHILSDDEDDDVKSGISQTVSTNLQSRGSYQVRFDTPQPSSLNGSLYSNLDAIEEEPSNSDVRRSRTWHGSVTSHIVPSRSTSLIDIPNTLDTCVYSAYLYKSNRSGKFQRRLFNCY
ncbi:hypothetical protein HDV02_001596 [Globomyces sp. JEL0801]|nr:hypothetical protein HDV02_001596 [Globomyces sp. JEL0801]